MKVFTLQGFLVHTHNLGINYISIGHARLVECLCTLVSDCIVEVYLLVQLLFYCKQ